MVDTLISQDNVTEIRVIADDLDLITKQVSVWGKPPCILLHTFDYFAPCNTLDSKKRVSGIDLFCYRRLVLHQTTRKVLKTKHFWVKLLSGKIFVGIVMPEYIKRLEIKWKGQNWSQTTRWLYGTWRNFVHVNTTFTRRYGKLQLVEFLRPWWSQGLTLMTETLWL